nr:hypothetical protein [Streptomyces sp. I05A-00742]
METGRRPGGVVVHRGLVAQDLLISQSHLGPGIDTQLLGEQTPQPVIDPQRIGLPPHPAQRHHQQRAQRLTQRMLGHQSPQPRHRVMRTALFQPQLQQPLPRTELTVLQHRRRSGQDRATPLRQRTAPVKSQRTLQSSRFLSRARHLPRPGQSLLETQQIQLPVRDHHPVTGPLGDQQPPPVRNTRPQIRHDLAHLMPGRRGRPVRPHRIHQPRQRNHPVGLQQQNSQHGTRPRTAHPQTVVPVPYLKRAQHTEPDSTPP